MKRAWPMNEQDTAYGEREADYYEQCPDQTVVCRLCPHECHLSEGRQGRCRSRTNRGGKLYTLAYGRVCALHTDPVEKKPLYHFLPGSRCFSLAAAGCNLSCQNCQNWEISQASPLEVGCRRITPERLGETAACSGCRSVAYTYTEPLTYLEFTRDCAAACKAKGLKNILVTAGYVNEKPLADLLPYIDAANIDLKSFSDDTYRRISHAHLAPVLRTLLLMKEAGVWTEITNLVIPSVNDNREQVRTLCRWLADNGLADSPLHFSRFFPRYRLGHLPPTPVETLLQARQTAREEGMRFVYIGNTNLPGAEDTCCPHCGKRLVRRDIYQVSPHRFSGCCPDCGQPIPGVWT